MWIAVYRVTYLISGNTELSFQPGVVTATLISAVRMQDLCEMEASMVYIVSSRTLRERDLV